eukprot:2575702-Pyramimonas_sp.AAC.1
MPTTGLAIGARGGPQGVYRGSTQSCPALGERLSLLFIIRDWFVRQGWLASPSRGSRGASRSAWGP